MGGGDDDDDDDDDAITRRESNWILSKYLGYSSLPYLTNVDPQRSFRTTGRISFLVLTFCPPLCSPLLS